MRGLLIAWLFTVSQIQAQTFESTNWIKVQRDVDRQSVYGVDDDVIQVCQTLDSRGKWRLLDVPLDSLTPLVESEIELSGGVRLEELLSMRDSSFLFFSFYDRDERSFGMMRLARSKGNPTFQLDTIYTKAWSRADLRPEIHVSLTPDSLHFLIAQTLPAPRKKDDPVVLSYHEMSGTLLWQKELVLPYSADASEILSVHVSNEGFSYILTGVELEKGKNASAKFKDSHSVLFCYNYRSNKLKEYDVSFKDKHVLSAALLIDSSGVVRVFGYYSEIQEQFVRGTFLFVISAAGGPFIRATYMPMDTDFMSLVVGASDRPAESISNLFLDHYFLLPNREMMLVGERFHQVEYASIDPITNTVRMTHYNHYDDIVIHVLDSTGKMVRQLWVPKQQTTTGTNLRWCSYTMEHCGDVLRFYYNDAKSNDGISSRKGKGLDEWTGQRQDDIHVYEIGQKERDFFLNHPAGSKELFQPNPTMPFDGCNVALYFQNGREFCLIVPKF
ncbi:MAG: hypothetical protein ACKO66_10890 [Flavobacteriales bacterium]